VNHFPDDAIVQLAGAVAAEKWAEVSGLMVRIPREEVEADFQFYNEISLKLWRRFVSGHISEPSILEGVLHVWCMSPSPCPMDLTLAALQFCGDLESRGQFAEGSRVASSALDSLETFRDSFAVRKAQKIRPSSGTLPDRPLDQGYQNFERWLECLHVDLLTVWVRCRLKHALEAEVEAARQAYPKAQAKVEEKKRHEEQMYGSLNATQRAKYEALLGQPFVPPIHSRTAEEKLLEQFKCNFAAKALIYVEMAFFRPKDAVKLLEKARGCIDEFNKLVLPPASPFIYANRTEIGLVFNYNMPGAKTVAVFGKENVGSCGITLSNTALQGTGIKTDQTETFVVSQLKPNCLYTFAFGGFDSHGQVLDQLLEPFSIATCHSLSLELVWSYVASAAYRLNDHESFDKAMLYLLSRYAAIRQVGPEIDFHKYSNPFNCFRLKPTTLSEPAPALRAFVWALIMAARLFASKPLHATAFHRLGLIISRVLKTSTLTLTLCQEMFSVLQPMLMNTYHTRWTIQPLLHIVSALTDNKDTKTQELHQALLARTAFAIDSILVPLYQERTLSVSIVANVLESPANPWRSSFLLFASKSQLLDSATNDATLPLVAADIFRNSPERCYDDLTTRFRADPVLGQNVVYLISCAHNCGYIQQAITWSGQGLEVLKSQLHESEEKMPNRRANPRDSKMKKGKPNPAQRNLSKVELTKDPMEEAENAAATKIQTVYNHFRVRTRSLAKFLTINKWRAALNLISAMCVMECEIQPSATTPQQTDRGLTVRRSLKTKPAHPKDKKAGEKEVMTPEKSLTVLTSLRRAIVLADRARDPETARSAANIMIVYLRGLAPGSPIFTSVCQAIPLTIDALISYLPLDELWVQRLILESLVMILSERNSPIVAGLLAKASMKSERYGNLFWMLRDIPAELKVVQLSLQKRDAALNIFYAADAILWRSDALVAGTFTNEAYNKDDSALLKAVCDLSVNLQHRQKLSMSVSILTRLAFTFFGRNNLQFALQRLYEALECHFRVVRAHERVEQILDKETEDGFYKKHSWSGCLSIAVISSLLAKYSPRNSALMLVRLAAFSLSSIFTACPSNPKKSIDFADYEPPEIIPGIDLLNSPDPNQPLLDAPSPDYVTSALMFLLSALNSYEMHFEMFKPLAFARHFFRFIVRERRALARVRLLAVTACAQFGLLAPAVKILGDVVTCFGQSRLTKETALYPKDLKRFTFDVSESPASNLECVKALASVALVQQVAQNYGTTISHQFALCVARVCCVFSESIDLTGSPAEAPASAVPHPSSRRPARSHHRRRGGAADDSPGQSSSSFSSQGETTEAIFKLVDTLLGDSLNKEFRPELVDVKRELMLERAQLYMKQWRWDSAIKLASGIIQEMTGHNMDEYSSVFVDAPLLLHEEIRFCAGQVVGRASYNIRDYVVCEHLGSPYCRSLIAISKADFEGAIQLLTAMTVRKPVTRFHLEYVLSIGQLVRLIANTPPLIELWHTKSRLTQTPLEFLRELVESTMKFFIDELGMKESRSYYLRFTHLLARLKLLEASILTESEAIRAVEAAATLMKAHCPYVSRGLNYQLLLRSLKMQMNLLLASSPQFLHFWNAANAGAIDFEKAEQISGQLTQILTSTPDMMIFPVTEPAILDLLALVGVLNIDSSTKVEQSYSVLRAAYAVRSIKRIVQMLVPKYPDGPPTNCPNLLLNDNHDQTQRSIASAYFAHVCSLELPYFDLEILEVRSYLFYRFFEDQFDCLKLTYKATAEADAGIVAGQWYEVDTKLFEKTPPPPDHPAVSAKSGVSSMSSAKATRRSFGSTQLKGILYFFLGIVVEGDDPKKKAPTGRGPSTPPPPAVPTSIRLNPLVMAAQLADLQTMYDDFAEIGVTLEEAAKLELAEAESDTPMPAKEAEVAGKGGARKKPPPKAVKPIDSPEVSVLHHQAELLTKRAELLWGVSVSKAELVFTKSNRMIAALMKQKDRWPAEVNLTGIEMPNAFPMAHFFNADYAINEKAAMLGEWLLRVGADARAIKTEVM
jgi:hypothetical protein